MRSFTNWGIEGGYLKLLNPDPGRSNRSIVYRDENRLIRGWKAFVVPPRPWIKTINGPEPHSSTKIRDPWDVV
jgi:hypothetical protein